MKKILVLSFLSGFLATLIFHQGFVGLLYVLDILPSPPFNMSATQPFGVPSVISLSFFGGLWGVLIWWIVLKKLPMQQLILSVVMGALGPTIVAFFVVFPIKGVDVPISFFPVGLLLNGAWGFGLWIFMSLMVRKRNPEKNQD